jgi:hypothetical protein
MNAETDRSSCGAALLAGLTMIGLAGAVLAGESPGTAAATPAAPAATADLQPLEEILIQAPEPRYVAPTRRDSIGRIWAPVYINDKGPFRLALDTGANRSGVVASVVADLHMQPDSSAQLMLQGVTGATAVNSIHADSLLVGDVLMKPSTLPILPDALGGAEGVLGSEVLTDRRVFIDFRRDLIIIARSHGQRAPYGYEVIPFQFERGRLLVVDAKVGDVRAKAIIDTGAQVTVANLALRRALSRRAARHVSIDRIEGVTKDVEEGEGYSPPPITFGHMEIRCNHMTFADMNIFQHWHLTKEPALMIGMDAIGQLETMVIDYRLHELQLLMHTGS